MNTENIQTYRIGSIELGSVRIGQPVSEGNIPPFPETGRYWLIEESSGAWLWEDDTPILLESQAVEAKYGG